MGWFLWATPKHDISLHQMTGDVKTDMFTMMAEMNSNLISKSGDVFDIAFLDHMIIHHQGAIDAANMAFKNAKHEEIKNLSKEIIEAQAREIEQMKVWQKEWYYNN